MIAVLLPLAVWPALIAASGAYAKDPAHTARYSLLAQLTDGRA
jgi:hypothetical protein